MRVDRTGIRAARGTVLLRCVVSLNAFCEGLTDSANWSYLEDLPSPPGSGLSTYTLDWTGATNLFRPLFFPKPELHAL